MKLIVGLGNPGKQYDKTRHNIGFMCINHFSLVNQLEFDKNKFNGLYTEALINNEKVIILKPQSYINLSGEVIKKFVDYFKIDIRDILIICDDMDLPVGSYKLRLKGGSAGHNGLKDIEKALNTNEYHRLKIGIGKDKNIDVVNYVLGKFNPIDKKIIEDIIKIVPDIINDYMTMTFENLMNKYN
ncbi:MAG: aminoacyl-tRNA hydrolase [Bacilli bacterium]